ncbi:MAG TPA: hypothetical protein VG206_17515 [Terriglobia bacterium]|nr:hypothetical protein [Terriglobia bacterium]
MTLDRKQSPDFKGAPWHRFGTILNGVLTSGEGLRKAGLDWQLLKIKDPANPGKCLLVAKDRNSHGADTVLGATRDTTAPFQNEEAFTLLDPLVENGLLAFDSMGYFRPRDGSFRIWAVCRVGGYVVMGKHDRVAKFVLFIHFPVSGYHRLSFLCLTLDEQSVLIEDAPHNPQPLATTPRIIPRRFIDDTHIVIEKIDQRFASLVRNYQELIQVQLGPRAAMEYFANTCEVFNLEQEKMGRTKLSPEDREDRIRKCGLLFESVEEPTLWNAYRCFVKVNDNLIKNEMKDDFLFEIWFSHLKGCALRVALRIATGM